MAQDHTQVPSNPDHETILVGRNQVRFLITGAESNGSAALLEVLVPAGPRLPALPHSHDAGEESVYGLEGVSTWTVAEATIELAPGQALCIPRGTVHEFANLGAADARMLVVISPAVLGPAFFRAMGALLQSAAGRPPDQEKMAALMRRSGATPVLSAG